MHGGDGFLLPAEAVVEEARGAVLVNLEIAGTLFVTNYRLVFLGGGAKLPLPLGTIPLLSIENFSKQVGKTSTVSSSTASRRLLTVVGKDLRTITFGFLPHTKQRRKVREALAYRTRPTRLFDLYAFSDASHTSGDPCQRLRAEYIRLISGSNNASRNLMEQFQRGNAWRLCEANATYSVCPTYPSLLVMPSSVSDEEVQQAALFRARGRLAHLCWQHPDNGAVLARSSQPFTGFGMTRSPADEKLVAIICNTANQRRKLYIADARPRKNALANGAMGGGSESSANYLQSEVIFLGIDNIHGMRDSLTKMREFLDTHGACSSDGSSSLLRSGGRAWVGGNVASVAGAASALGDSGWLLHCHKILTSAVWIACRIHLEGASVLVHCSDGWDRTAQLVSLASLLLDPYYRTFQGFQALIEKDWLAFGHNFSDRLGIPTFTGTRSLNVTDSMMRQAGQASTSPGRGAPETSSSPSVGSQSPGAQSSHYSPIFLQWLDAVAQLLRIYPSAFEFTQAYLVELMDCVLSCRFGNFLCNSEKERVQGGVAESTACVWAYLKHVREPRGKEHKHCNLLYNSSQNPDVLLPPAAASAPSLWRQYFLRWSCPSLENTGGNLLVGWAHGGDLESATHGLAETFSSVRVAKDRAEERVQELLAEKNALLEQLREEKEGRIQAMASAMRRRRETAALKQMIEAVGCKIRINNLAPLSLDASDDDSSPDGRGDRAQASSTIAALAEDDNSSEEPGQLSVSVSIQPDMDATTDVYRRPDYNSSCRLRPGESCRWPQTGCARIGSAFIGLRADFAALERLAILESYFDSEQQPDLKGDRDVQQPPLHVSGVT
jgi:myotubularin-related protein 1/2